MLSICTSQPSSLPACVSNRSTVEMKPDRIKWNSFQAASRMVSPPIVTIVKSPLMPWRQGFPNQFMKYRNRGMNIFTSAFVCKRAKRHHLLSAWNLLRLLSTQTKHICYNTELSVLFDNSRLFSSAIFDKVPVSILHRQWPIYLKHAHTNACPHTHTVTETLRHAHTYTSTDLFFVYVKPMNGRWLPVNAECDVGGEASWNDSK